MNGLINGFMNGIINLEIPRGPPKPGMGNASCISEGALRTPPRAALTRRPRRSAAAAAPFSLDGGPLSLGGAPQLRGEAGAIPKPELKNCEKLQLHL